MFQIGQHVCRADLSEIIMRKNRGQGCLFRKKKTGDLNMKDMTIREKIIFLILGAIAVGAICYSWDCLLVKGVLAQYRVREEYRAMMMELAVLFCLWVLILRLPAAWSVRTAGAAALMAAFLWIHRMLVPVIAAGGYIGFLCGAGGWLRYRWTGEKERNPSREFLTGCLFVVCVFCLMSALGIGRILYLWVFVLIMTIVMFLDKRFWKNWLKGWRSWLIKAGKEAVCLPERKEGRWNLCGVCMGAAVLVFFCIQAGRMNIALDYDSLWYGVRSPYILDNGRGIYENMGTIAIVYTYSKGMEVLTLPLSILPSYSFGICFNWWLLAGVLAMSYGIGRIYVGSRARLLVVFLASMPGIMNMGITAKSDVCTLYFQLMMIYELLLYLKGEKQALWYSLAAFFFTWTLKPTALVFSTAVLGMSGIYLVATGRLFSRITGKERKNAAATVILSLAALGGIWARTLLITGLPVTSVFSSILTKLGFQLKYPYSVQKIPNSSAGRAKIQWIKDTLKRIYGILLDPQGIDMDHVILAWGSVGVLFLICTWLLWYFLKKREQTSQERLLDGYLHVMCIPFFACSVISLILLTQVDGNYFMLFYVLLTVYVFRLINRLTGEKLQRGIWGLTVPIILFSAVVTCLTNWSGTIGFTPASWKHGGYYDHEAEQYQRMSDTGNGKIWDIVAKNPKNRLIAMGEHPAVLAFPCSTQSYLDIIGSWGNEALVKSMDNFVEFLKYAKTDYIYIQAGYMQEEHRVWTLTCDSIEHGILVPIYYEQGNMLAEVDVDGQMTEQSVKGLQEFKEKYRKEGE